MVMLYALVAVCALSRVLVDGSYVLDTTVKTEEHFNFSRLVRGQWRLVQVSEGSENSVDKCLEIIFQFDENNNKKLIFSGLNPYTHERCTQTSYVISDSDPAKLRTDSQSNRVFWIVGTDYQTYVIVYRSFKNHRAWKDYAFILVKNNALVGPAVAAASTVARKKGFYKNFVPIDCPKAEMFLYCEIRV